MIRAPLLKDVPIWMRGKGLCDRCLDCGAVVWWHWMSWPVPGLARCPRCSDRTAERLRVMRIGMTAIAAALMRGVR